MTTKIRLRLKNLNPKQNPNNSQLDGSNLNRMPPSSPSLPSLPLTTNVLPLISTSILPPISSEQMIILNAIGRGVNLTVDAVAGSGKTTTCLYLALQYPSKSILLLTYNAKLKLETRHKVRMCQIDNMEVHSYHSFGVRYWSNQAYTDQGLLNYFRNHQTTSVPQYDLIIVDEAQDMNPLYYRVVQMLMPTQLMVMGDRHQSIYAFNQADSRFLTLSSKLFNPTSIWEQATLSTSYRVTEPMTHFLNHCCRGVRPINAIKKGPLVHYVICNSFDSRPFQIVMKYLQQNVQLSDIFILSPSVKSERSPIRQLANKLTEKGIPIYVPTSDEEKLDEDLLNGKIVFSTFHQVKGLERQIVLVFNFDITYLQFYARDWTDWSSIPNTLYVALTRAQKELVVIHDSKCDYLPFLNLKQLRPICHFEIYGPFRPIDNRRNQQTKELKVTDLVKFIPGEVIDHCLQQLTFTIQQSPLKSLQLPIKIQQDDLFEGVSEITGTAIPSYYEYQISGKMTIYQYLHKTNSNSLPDSIKGKCMLMDDDDNNHHDEVEDLYQMMIVSPTDEKTCQTLLHLTTLWMCQKSGYNFKKSQIKEYNWLSPEILKQAIDRLNNLFPVSVHHFLQFEKKLTASNQGLLIVGFTDIWDSSSNELWELKMVRTIDPTHLLQTVIYGWMLNQMGQRVKKLHVYNIHDGTYYQITSTPEQLMKVVEYLVRYKLFEQQRKNDQDFLKSLGIV